jgi:hypothetical protein
LEEDFCAVARLCGFRGEFWALIDAVAVGGVEVEVEAAAPPVGAGEVGVPRLPDESFFGPLKLLFYSYISFF